MTRGPYMARLALGRSAYEPVEESGTRSDQQRSAIVNIGRCSDTVQQYDPRGNPVNPQSRSLQEAQIRAKNEVLEAAGVCERKNKKCSSSGYVRLSPEEWAILRDQENEWGNDLFLFADIAHLTCSWWIETLLSRIQTGFVDSSVPFSTTLISEWHKLSSNGIKHAFDYLSSGALMGALHRMIMSYSDDSIQAFFADFRSTIRRLKIGGPAKRFLLHHTRHIKNFTQTLLLLFLTPLPIYSALAQLHLYSSPYGLPPAASFLPWHPSSPLIWAWTSGPETAPLSTRFYNLSTSPVSLVLAMNALYDWVDHTGAVFEEWEQPSILGPPSQLAHSISHSETETPWLLRPIVWTRDRVLDLLGWSPKTWERVKEDRKREDDAGTREQARLRSKSDPLDPISYRRSALAFVPAELLSRRLHSLVWRVMLLPLEGWVFRSVARSWLQSGLPGVSSSPLSSLSLSNVLGPRDWGAGGMLGYASKVGLCIGLHTVVDTMVWGLAYRIVKSYGVGRFHWGET
ncbi:hypothetical protein MBLNU457_1930t1 [Dothideomycetes sp. NU457]